MATDEERNREFNSALSAIKSDFNREATKIRAEAIAETARIQRMLADHRRHQQGRNVYEDLMSASPFNYRQYTKDRQEGIDASQARRDRLFTLDEDLKKKERQERREKLFASVEPYRHLFYAVIFVFVMWRFMK